MLIQITTVCNFSCAHCCMSCGKAYKGQHMDEAVYLKALDFVADMGDYIVLSGGEPTLHPKFIRYLAIAIGYEQNDIKSGIPPWFATNGSKTKLTLELMRNASYCEEEFFEKLTEHAFIEYTDEPLFNISLSQDIYHDPIDASVVSTARALKHEIRDVTYKVVNAGFAVENNIKDREGCCCNSIQIKPDGAVFLCGCDDSPYIGHVVTGIDSDQIRKLTDKLSDEGEECYQNLTPKMYKKFSCIDSNYTVKDWVANNIPLRRLRSA